AGHAARTARRQGEGRCQAEAARRQEDAGETPEGREALRQKVAALNGRGL
ncbi:MAG: hypothetical protein QOK01_2135, partial [Alphaproteobacteria bacterium]|nr:hypothetical protein [Alphaproteobacteria bacterium]